jgi:hypothetical protein
MDETPADIPAGPPPPPAPPGPVVRRFDGSFVGPLLPPAPPSAGARSAPGPGSIAPPAVTDDVLAIPLGTRKLVSMALDLLTRTDSGLRSASFYIGLVMLMTVGPAVTLFGVIWLRLGDAAFTWYVEPGYSYGDPGPWTGWLVLAALPAMFGYLVASVEATALAVAVIGGRAEGRPLRLRESIAVVRRRFWRVLGAGILTGIVTSIATLFASSLVHAAIGTVDAIDFGVSLVVGLVVGAPFVYVTAGIVIGEVGVGTAIGRSLALVRARKQLAVVVTLFGVVSQFIVVFGLSEGIDTVYRLATGTGLADTFPPVLAIPVIAAFVFALGTLTFIVEAIAEAPAVYAFTALTHYTRGLEVGRREPLRVDHVWDPYITPGLAIGGAIALLALLAGIGSLPG